MPRISRYSQAKHQREWVEASDEEHAAWKAARAEKRRQSAQSQGQPSERLETDDTPETPAAKPAARSKRTPGAKSQNGPLTPVLGLLSRFGAVACIRVTGAFTGGRHAMTPAEAISIAAPALRIVNRELGKRVRWVPKGGEHAHDIEQIGMGIGSWVLRGVTGADVSMPPHRAAPAQAATASATYAAPEPMPEPEAAPVSDASGGDIFAGSEPIGPSGAAPMRTAPSGPADAIRVPDSVWNMISPPETGLSAVMG